MEPLPPAPCLPPPPHHPQGMHAQKPSGSHLQPWMILLYNKGASQPSPSPPPKHTPRPHAHPGSPISAKAQGFSGMFVYIQLFGTALTCSPG